MKKLYFLFLFSGLITGFMSSCSNDEKNDPYLPTPPQVSIENRSGKTSCSPGETIELKAKLDNPLPTIFRWQLESQEVSSDSIYRFTSTVAGHFDIVLTAINKDGTDSDTLSIEVKKADGKFHFSDLKHWTGAGADSSILAIQWITGNDWTNPTDNEVFFLAWGYRWDKANQPSGIDMLKAIVQNDPRLYVALSGSYVIGFGYDGDNDGKIELANSTLHLTQDDFTNGIYETSGSNFDDLHPTNSADYWMGGKNKAYTTYWLGSGEVIPETNDFEYSPTFVSNRRLENLSWDVWTLSSINSSMNNAYPISRLIKAADANK